MFFGSTTSASTAPSDIVASGLVAVVFSTIVFMTPIGMRIAFGTPIRPRLLVGAALGVTGVALLFLPELRAGVGGSTLRAASLLMLARRSLRASAT